MNYKEIAIKTVNDNTLNGLTEKLKSLYRLIVMTPEQKNEIDALRSQYEKESAAMKQGFMKQEHELMTRYIKAEIETLNRIINK